MASLESALGKAGLRISADGVAAKAILYSTFAFSTYYVGSFIFSYLRVLLSLFILPGSSFSKFGPKGSWVVITGASDGIGKEFALQIARKGYNLVLISRTASKLSTLAQEIEGKNSGVSTKMLAMDFSQPRDSDFQQLTALLHDLDVSVLINNVGQSHSVPVTFAETSEKEMTDIVTINCLGTLRVTRIVAPLMVRRRRGLILTMASFAGITPTPLLATYSGSKAFLQFWSSALASELAPNGITVQLVQSYLVTSAMSKIRRASATIPSAKAFVRSALAKIGRSGGAQGVANTVTPYWAHGLMHWALLKITGTMNSLVINQNRGMHEQIRKRALRKAEREAKKA